jgi:hypothetical protein
MERRRPRRRSVPNVDLSSFVGQMFDRKSTFGAEMNWV